MTVARIQRIGKITQHVKKMYIGRQMGGIFGVVTFYNQVCVCVCALVFLCVH